MKQIHTDILIDASAARVWEVLSDFAAFPEWNPFLKAAKGDLMPGSKLEVRIKPEGGAGMTFKPTVLKAEPGKELRWLGRLVMRGVFDGEHHFIIESLGESQVRFIQGERFTGVLVPIMALMGLFGKTEQGFGDMNQALKARAEQAA